MVDLTVSGTTRALACCAGRLARHAAVEMSTAEAAVLPGTGPKQATGLRLRWGGKNLRSAGVVWG